jgi:hypothetical protein
MMWRSAMIAIVLLAGCKSSSGNSGGGIFGGFVPSKPIDKDPLFGASAAPIDAKPIAFNPTGTPTSDGGAGILGTPMSNTQPLAQPTASSTAVLATGSYPPLSGGQDLRIGPPPPGAGNRVLPRNQTPRGVIAVVTADPDYGKPKEAVPGVVAVDPTAKTVAQPVSSAVGGLESALANIAAMNPKWHKLESVGSGQWRFSCAIPDRADPTKSRHYEGEGPTAFVAVQNALEHIQRDLKK